MQMMRRVCCGLSLLLLGVVPLLSQDADSSWRVMYTQPGPYTELAVDPLGNAYVLTPDEQLLKFNPVGQQVFHYYNTVLGAPGSIDASDPFNILLFYPEQQTIVQLNRTLNESSILDLRLTDIRNATAVARSHDNELWLYDDYQGRLYKLNSDGLITFTSDDLRLSEKLAYGPSHIFRWQDRLLLNFPERGVAVFTLYGQLETWWDILGISDWQGYGKQLLVQLPQGWSYYSPLADQLSIVDKWWGQAKHIVVQAATVLLLQNDGRLVVKRALIEE